MARPLRIEYDGAIYHVMARGNQGRDLFAIEWERRCWLETLEEVVDRAGWRVHAYVQMTTHYHMLLETPSANLVAGMKWFQQTFTQRTNAFHKSWGHVYQGRYKAILVDDEDASYFRTVGEYIHLNPVEAGLVSVKDPRLELYRYSSYPYYLSSPGKRPKWLSVDRLMSSVHIVADTAKGRRAYASYMDERTRWAIENKDRLKDHADWKSLRRGWFHGSSDFRERMMEYLEEQEGVVNRQDGIGEQKRDYSLRGASLALTRGLKHYGLKAGELGSLPKSDERKMMLSGVLKKYFSVSNAWISEQLSMGHRSTVTRAMKLYRTPTRKQKQELQKLIRVLKLSS